MVVGWNAGKEGTKLGPREGGRLQARRILAQRHHSAEPGTEDEKVKQTGKRPRTNLVSPFHGAYVISGDSDTIFDGYTLH